MVEQRSERFVFGPASVDSKAHEIVNRFRRLRKSDFEHSKTGLILLLQTADNKQRLTFQFPLVDALADFVGQPALGA